ncbi:uncharacterized protein N7484_004946 [Penicillium longicatenatum]|uniref:uncharacterized protein n=1 Tax=Penicillium longicatenatum TaxID=1561947 RepID=UPI00254665CD|nr:uncharacterized protein N7484_004946 [Penicillium longicatenatum]KAJ5651223.1 hypothetical protein N7484_004946 [Penicillium longicatenatum]
MRRFEIHGWAGAKWFGGPGEVVQQVETKAKMVQGDGIAWREREMEEEVAIEKERRIHRQKRWRGGIREREEKGRAGKKGEKKRVNLSELGWKEEEMGQA